jgi:AraC-like DNA-binding protein
MLQDEEWIRYQYLERELPVAKIQQTIRCPRDVLEWWANKYGIELRDDVQYRKLYDRTWLYQKYVDEDLTLNQLAEEIGCSVDHLNDRLIKLDVQKADTTPSKPAVRSKYPRVFDEDWLRKKYINENMMSDEIADTVGCSSSHIRSKLADFGIRKYEPPPELKNEPWLRERFINEGLSDREIAAMIGVNPSVVADARKAHGITREAKYPKLRDDEWLRRNWEDELLTMTEIGEKAGGANKRTVRRWLFKHDIL